MDVEFKDLTYTLPKQQWGSKGSKKVILKSLSGRFRPGQLAAILGPSGAGKSSLLNALSGLKSTGVSGSLLTNGRPRNEQIFRTCSCYITQDDLLQPLMTIRELMMFAAKLKMSTKISFKERSKTVTDILNKMGLSQNEGTFTENLSGGQKKRLSVALELINNPPIFFLDEPTSGLDNVSAKHCLQMLRSLSQQGRTIVCTIHQPSASIFDLFDHIYVVSQGLCVYQGTTKGLLPFLSSVGLHCPLNYNPADYVIELTDGDEVNNIKALSSAIDNGKTIWKESAIDSTNKMADNNVNDDEMSIKQFSSMTSEVKAIGYGTSWWGQFTAILSRMTLQIMRNRTALWIQLIHHFLCSSLIGLVFYNSANDGVRWVLHLKCIISIVLFHTYTWVLVPVLTYPSEVKLLKREHFNRWYSLTAYFVALNISRLPGKIFFSLIFLINIYWNWGMPMEIERLSWFCLFGVLTSLVSEGMGFAIGSTFNVTNGAAIGPACISPLLGLAVYGFDFAHRIPWFTDILMRLSFVHRSTLAFTITTFGLDRQTLDCNDTFGYCHFGNPKVLLRMLNLEERSIWEEIGTMLSMLMLFKLLFFILLWRRLKT